MLVPQFLLVLEFGGERRLRCALNDHRGVTTRTSIGAVDSTSSSETTGMLRAHSTTVTARQQFEIGATWAWKRRDLPVSRLALASATAVSSLWAYHLLGQTADWLPWLRYLVLIAGLGAAAILAALPMLQQVAPLTAMLAVVALLAAPAAYAVQTASTPHTGALPTAGPSGSSTLGGRGGFGGRNGGPGFGGRPGFRVRQAGARRAERHRQDRGQDREPHPVCSFVRHCVSHASLPFISYYGPHV